MKSALFGILIAVGLHAQSLPSFFSYGFNLNSQTIAALHGLGFFPDNYGPNIQVFINDQVANSADAYRVTVTYLDTAGTQQTAIQVIQRSDPRPDGSIVTLCIFFVDAQRLVSRVVESMKATGQVAVQSN